MTDLRIELPEKVEYILKTLRSSGYEAYAVGGCVRDSLLGRTPDDWDITTSARPQQVKSLFRRTVDTGIKHGTVTVMLGNEGFEVTTYRIDGEYEDGRHPKEVTFTASLEEDLKRRDFTINAMAYNPEEGIIDLFGGMEDIGKGMIRAVGDPEERFSEDALRIMRAVRFSAQLGYEISPDTRAAAEHMAVSLGRVSAERICTELTKLLVSPNPGKLRTAYECGITAVILPELDRCMETPQHNTHHCFSVGEHIIRSVEAVRADRVLRYTMLFHDMAKPECRVLTPEGEDFFPDHAVLGEKMAAGVMKRLRFDAATMNRVCVLVREHDRRIDPTPAAVRKAVSEIGTELFPLLFEIRLADGAAQSEGRLDHKRRYVEEIRGIYEGIIERGECLDLRSLAVKGSDLKEAGMRPGREMGALLGRMLDAVLEDPSLNDRQLLMERFCPETTDTRG